MTGISGAAAAGFEHMALSSSGKLIGKAADQRLASAQRTGYPKYHPETGAALSPTGIQSANPIGRKQRQ